VPFTYETIDEPVNRQLGQHRAESEPDTQKDGLEGQRNPWGTGTSRSAATMTSSGSRPDWSASGTAHPGKTQPHGVLYGLEWDQPAVDPSRSAELFAARIPSRV
jgi:hypothetical protein